MTLKSVNKLFIFQNSIRHNLSLHNKFMHIPNDGVGKSSWWKINPKAKRSRAFVSVYQPQGGFQLGVLRQQSAQANQNASYFDLEDLESQAHDRCNTWLMQR